MDDATGKDCADCAEWKSLDDFYRAKAGRYGRMACCKRCAEIRRAARAAAHPELVKAQAARKYQRLKSTTVKTYRQRPEVRERARARGRARYASDPEYRARQAELVKAWMAEHKDEMRAHYHKKRAKRRAAEVDGLGVDLSALWDGACGICRASLDADLTYPDPLSKSVDHIVPLSKGGTHTQDNLQWAHLSCNARKGAKVD